MITLTNHKVSGGLTIQTLTTPGNLLSIFDSSGAITSVTPASIITAGGGVTGSGTNGRMTLWGASGVTSNAAFTYTVGSDDAMIITQGVRNDIYGKTFLTKAADGTDNQRMYADGTFYTRKGIYQGKDPLTSPWGLIGGSANIFAGLLVSEQGYQIVDPTPTTGDKFRFANYMPPSSEIYRIRSFYGVNNGLGGTAGNTYTSSILELKANGDIGVGTSSFADKFTIVDNGTASGRAGLYVNSTGANVATGYAGYFSKTGASVNNTAIYVSASGGTTNYGIYSAAGLNYFSGNVGIGAVPAATTDFPLTVSSPNTTRSMVSLINTGGGDPQIVFFQGASARWAVGYEEAGTLDFKIRKSTASMEELYGTTQFLIKGSNGFIGINNINPTAFIDIKGTDLGSTDAFAIRNSAGTQTFSIGNNGVIKLDGSQKMITSDASLELRNNATGNLTLTSSGNYNIILTSAGAAGKVLIPYLGTAGIVTNTSAGVLGTSTFASLLSGASVPTGSGSNGQVALWGASGLTGSSRIQWLGSGAGPNLILQSDGSDYALQFYRPGYNNWQLGSDLNSTGFNIYEAGTARMMFASGGNIGIGITPSSTTRLTVVGANLLNNSFGTASGIFSSTFTGTTDNANGVYISTSNYATGPGNTSITGNIEVYTNSSTSFGISGSAQNNVASYTGTMIGIRGLAGNRSGTLAGAIGVRGELYSASGTTITSAYALRADYALAAGTVSNLYGLYIPATTAGTVSNYAIYAVSGSSYFGGNTGFGITSPQYPIDVAGNAMFRTTAQFSNGRLFQLGGDSTKFTLADLSSGAGRTEFFGGSVSTLSLFSGADVNYATKLTFNAHTNLSASIYANASGMSLRVGTGDTEKLRLNPTGAAVTIPSFGAIGVVTNDASGNLATTPYATLGPLLAASTNYWTKTGSDLSYTAGNVTAAKTIMLSAGGIAQGMNTAAYSFRDVHVAAYAASATGVLDIELGLTMNSQFNVWKVKGYSYSANAEWECTVGFHNDYAAFYAVRGHFAGHPPFEKVRISLKGGKIHLLLGETSTVWSISTVVVSEGMTAGTTPSALGTFSSSITTDVTTGHTLTGNVNMYPAKITVQETNESEYAMVTTSSYNTRIVTRYDSAEPFYISNQGIKLFGAKSGLGSAGSTTYVNGYYGVTLRAGSGGPEANNILFYGDGSTGNVGIGTTSTPDKLTLSAGSMLLNNNYAIRFKDAGGTAYNILKFTSSDNIELRGSSATDTYIGPAGTGMVVKSTGNVGFGTATPGTIVQAGDGTGQRTIKLYSGSSGAGNNAPVLSLFSNGHKEGVIAITGNGMVFANTSGLANYNNGTIDANPHIVIGNTGLVGVGGTPAYNFDVIGSGTVTSRIRSTSGLATLNLEGTNGSIINGTGNMYLSNYSATQHIYISANGGNQITALANGNVAVNGTAPTTNLHVFGTDTYAANTDGQFTISDATTPLKKMTMGFDITNNFGYINTIYQGASIMPLVLNPQGGNVAIGTTTADSKFRVAASNGAGLRIDFSGSNINYYNANTHIIADSSNALLMELSTGYLRIPKFTTAGNILTVDDVNGVITSVTPASLGIVNWYTTDGTLTSNRTVTQAGYTLNFTENIGVYGITVGRGPGNVDGNFTFATYSATTAKTGANNIFIGADAGKLLTSGSQNVFLGNFAGRDNVTGAGNVCIGQQAGKVYTSNSMTAVGNFALQNATQTNSAFGASALQFVTTGSTNVGIGPLAGSSGAAGKNLETGSYNTFLGPQSGFGIVSGSYNVVIGRTLTELAAGLSNNVIIGDGQGNIVYQASPTNTKIFVNEILRMDVTSSSTVLLYDTASSNALTIASTAGSASLTAQGTRPLNLVGGDYTFVSNSATTGIVVHKGGWVGFYDSITTDPTGADIPATASIWYNSTSGKFKMKGGSGTDTITTYLHTKVAINREIVAYTNTVTSVAVYDKGYYRIPAELDGYAFIGVTYNVLTAATGTGDMTIRTNKNGTGVHSTTLAVGDVQKNVSGTGITVATGDLLKFEVFANTMSGAPTGMDVTYFFSPI